MPLSEAAYSFEQPEVDAGLFGQSLSTVDAGSASITASGRRAGTGSGTASITVSLLLTTSPLTSPSLNRQVKLRERGRIGIKVWSV